jgi:tetratricopeptide (TPR) repeat protein
MDEHAAAPGPQVRAEADAIVRLQTILARRVLLIFALPLLVIMILGMYTYYLSGKMDTLNTLQRIAFIERMMQKTQSHEWALREYEELAKKYPHPQVLVRLGALYYESRGPQEALKKLDQAQEMEPTYWEIYSTRAYIHWQQDNIEQAIHAGEKALDLNPHDAQTYNLLAWVYAHEAPVVDLSKALDYAVKAVAYTRGRDDEAVDTLETLLAVSTTRADLDHAMAAMEREINQIHKYGAEATFLQSHWDTLRAR